ncbi:hypothetical protein FDP56_04650 [Enterococcus casseliflavus]|uniref:hypothetical protein n=1 Tax=Enterococcus casseliflavus TaxID=37734 RepID=UPI00129C1F45|nr:hypothetical protein [Enterococcus casseliflavus]MRI69708.1 hypothetical protein [Enterococcus casseliflavus]
MGSLTIHNIKDRLESAIPSLLVAWNIENKPIIIDKNHSSIVAYTHHEKWILKAGISEYSIHIAAIISLLEQWDGQVN